MAGPKKAPVAAEPVDPEILAAREKLKLKMGVTQTGGKGSVRRGNLSSTATLTLKV